MGFGPGHLAREKGVKRGLEFGFDSDSVLGGLVYDDENLLEESLIEHALDVLGRGSIGLASVLGQIECRLQVAFDSLKVRAGGVHSDRDLPQGCGDAFLFFTEKVDRDGSGVVGFHELATLAFELVLLALEGLLFVGDVVSGDAESLTDHVLDSASEGRVEGDALVVGFNLLLDFVDQDRFLLAGGSSGVSPRAHEVRIFQAGG